MITTIGGPFGSYQKTENFRNSKGKHQVVGKQHVTEGNNIHNTGNMINNKGNVVDGDINQNIGDGAAFGETAQGGKSFKDVSGIVDVQNIKDANLAANDKESIKFLRDQLEGLQKKYDVLEKKYNEFMMEKMKGLEEENAKLKKNR